jgi:hypothetical protein
LAIGNRAAQRSDTSPVMASMMSSKLFTASDVALQGPPLFGLGDGMLDADPL